MNIALRRTLSPVFAALAVLVALLTAPARAGFAASPEVLTANYPVIMPDALADSSATADPLTLLTRSGGTVGIVAVAGRLAASFPTRCAAGVAAEYCPRAILQAASNPAHNPGTRPMRFGAVIALAATQTGDGENIMQKGYAASGTQWKLQVDGVAGKPSCVLAGGSPHVIYQVTAPVSVADGGWHTVECRRAGSVLRIVVDAVARGSVTVPAGLSITNSLPLCLGGKGVSANNDQFHGYLDAAWMYVG